MNQILQFSRLQNIGFNVYIEVGTDENDNISVSIHNAENGELYKQITTSEDLGKCKAYSNYILTTNSEVIGFLLRYGIAGFTNEVVVNGFVDYVKVNFNKDRLMELCPESCRRYETEIKERENSHLYDVEITGIYKKKLQLHAGDVNEAHDKAMKIARNINITPEEIEYSCELNEITMVNEVEKDNSYKQRKLPFRR